MSRAHRIGTIFSRVDGLIRKGHLNEVNKPLWFDVYRRFPPKYEPCDARKVPDVNVREIFYEEDRLRAKIHKEFEKQLGAFNLKTLHETKSQRLMRTYQEYISKGMAEQNVMKELKSLIL